MHRFDTPTRQSSIAILFILGRIFRMLLRQLWVFILVILFNPKKQVFSSFTLFIIGMAVFGAITSIISYFRLYYYIKDGELILEKGVLRKKKVAVPIDRIQTVNFKQGVLHRVFDVVSIEIDTAGSSGKEFSLEAIKKEDGIALRNVLESSRRAPIPVSLPGEEAGGEDLQMEETGMPATRRKDLVFQLNFSDLLRIGVSQNHFRTAGIIMVFFLSFFDDLEDAMDLDLTQKVEEWLGFAEEADVIYYLLIGIPFFLIISFLITLVRTIFQYFNLGFWRTDRGFYMESGLLTRQEVSANLQKIQFLRWDSSPLKRVFGMVAVRLSQAASVQVARKLSVNVPGCYEPHLEAIREAYFPEERSIPITEHGIHPRIIWRMFVLQGILPVILLMAFSYSWLESNVWIWLLWLPAALWLSTRYHRNWKWYVSEEGIRTSWGVVNHHSILLQWYKVQAVSIRQSYFLRRRGLTYLIFYTAAGAVSIPYIPIEQARELHDFVLYRTETDERKWM